MEVCKTVKPGPTRLTEEHWAACHWVAGQEGARMSPLLSVEDLTVHFAVRRGFGKKSADVVHAADDVSLAIEPGQTLALVGESGSGKTTVARAVLQLSKPTGGRIVFQGRDIGSLKRAAEAYGDERRPGRLPGPVLVAEPAPDGPRRHRRATAGPVTPERGRNSTSGS